MTHLSVPAWYRTWPDVERPRGGRMTLDRFRRLKEPELPALPVWLVLSKLELFIAPRHNVTRTVPV
jgi:hypothetical protein